MTKINVEDVMKLLEEWRRIQNLDPNQVELYENGQKVEIPQKYIDDWKFTGLGYVGFIETEFYKTGWIEDEPV